MPKRPRCPRCLTDSLREEGEVEYGLYCPCCGKIWVVPDNLTGRLELDDEWKAGKARRRPKTS